MPVLTVQINRGMFQPDPEGERRWTKIREAQRQAPKKLSHVTVTPTLDLPMTDGIHTSSHGNMVLAERLALAALGEVYGRPIAHRAPDASRAQAIEKGTAVVIHFDNVTSRMDTIDLTTVPFRVEDARGVAPIKAVKYPGGPKVHLELERPLEGKAVVHGMWGHNPPLPPYDMVRMMPMLSFYGLDILI
jgi:hypothetical protein